LHADLISFLQSAREHDAKVLLVSRHPGDLLGTLAEFKLLELFDGIFHLTDKGPKSRIAQGLIGDCLLIDDSFSERSECLEELGSKVVAVDPSAFSFRWNIFKY
jgi:hypothetical protein